MTNEISEMADTPEATPEASRTVTPNETKRAIAKEAKAARKPVAKAAKAAKVAKATGKAKAAKTEPRVDHVAEQQKIVGRKRIVWANKPVEWPKAAMESGKAAEKIIKAAGNKGLTWDQYNGSVNRLGYMIRNEAVKLLK